MSVNFKYFIDRIGRECEFKPLKNQLLMALKQDAENKYKNYPRLLRLMKRLYIPYRDRSRISHLLKDHYNKIFSFYLNKLFYFRIGGLSYDAPEAPTPVDFKLVYIYHYNKKEITIIKNSIKKYDIKSPSTGELVSVEGILKRIFIFTIASFAYMVEQVFERPFAFQFFNIDANNLPNDEWEVIAIISGREQ